MFYSLSSFPSLVVEAWFSPQRILYIRYTSTSSFLFTFPTCSSFADQHMI